MLYMTEKTYQTGVTSIVDAIEANQPVLAAVFWQSLVKDGASPVPLTATIKTVIFAQHGPAVDKKMAVLVSGLGMLRKHPQFDHV